MLLLTQNQYFNCGALGRRANAKSNPMPTTKQSTIAVLSFHKTGTMKTLASQADIGV